MNGEIDLNALVLPGAPGLFRLGSVARLVRRIDRDVPVGARGVVVQVLAGNAFIVAFRWSDDPAAVECEAFAEVGYADIALDLTDATGRAHAAWWLAARPEIASSFYVAYRTLLRASLEGKGLNWVDPEKKHLGVRFSAWSSLSEKPCWFHLPALSDLDPDDTRLLLDGSHWVGVEALRRVVLHVAGVRS